MFKNYLLIAIRNLQRNKAFSAINILGLSLGLACCMLIYLYTLDEISYDRFHNQVEQIYRITADLQDPSGNKHQTGNTGLLPGPSFQRTIPAIETFVRYQSEYLTVRTNNELFNQDAAYADTNFFRVFTLPLLSGSARSALDDPRSVVLNESLAIKFFGRTDIVGQTLELKRGENFEPYQVSAVMKNAPQNSSLRPQLLLSMKATNQAENMSWGNFFLNTFIKLKPGSDPSAVAAQMNRVYVSESAEEMAGFKKEFGIEDKTRYGLQPFTSMHLDPVYRADNGLVGASNTMYSYILSGIAILILVIACINFINLTLGRAIRRSREIGIRKAVGGQRVQLVIQFLGEAMVLCTIAFLLGILLVILSLPYFNELANKQLSFSYLLDARLIIGYISLLAITALLAGFYPAIILSGFNPVQTLYGKGEMKGKSLLARGMVVFQFALATFLIIAVITMYSQFNFLRNYDLGYNDKGVIRISTGSMDKPKLDLFRHELMKHPEVQQVAADQGGFNMTIARVNGSTEMEFNFKYIDEHYFPLFKIPVIKGRNFSAALVTDTAESVIVNESFVKKAGWQDPIGQVVDFYYRNRKYKVIGVIRDYHYQSLTEVKGPQLFTANPEMRFHDVYVREEAHDPESVQQHLAAVFKTFFPLQPFTLHYKDQENLQAYEAESKWKQMITFGAVLTIIISCIGLLGLATITAQRRTKEIGVRKVLGASEAGIIRILTADFLRMVVLAVIIAFPLSAWGINQWLQGYPYRINLQWWMYGLAGILVVGVAILAIGWQTLQAAKNNPVTSLKSQ